MKNKKQLWLISLSDYSTFSKKHFLFDNNFKAVDFIREKLKDTDYEETWIDVDWEENGDEYCTYLYFENETEFLQVYFEKIDLQE